MVKMWRPALETLSREEFEKRELKLFRKQMKYVTENSPFYHRKFKEAGVTPAAEAPDELMATLIAVEGEAGMQYLLGFTNFYVITRYNRSTNYALAVHELSREIARARSGQGAGP